MSDNDSDYVDVGEETSENSVEMDGSRRKSRKNKDGVKVRGKDMEWHEITKFSNEDDFRNSDLFGYLQKNFSHRKSRSFEYGDVENWMCKFARKTGYIPCPLQYKVIYVSTSSDVTVECTDPNNVHEHEEVDENTVGNAKQFRWTEDQTKIITEGVINHAKPNVIKRNLNNANVFGNLKPSKVQLYNKIANIKKNIFPAQSILNTHDLRQRVASNLNVPENEVEGHVVHHHIDDEKENEEPRFTIIFSTKKNLQRMSSDRLLQTDATYRLNWNGFPVFIAGKYP